MGPDNRAKVIGWLREFALTLELKIDSPVAPAP
jgi:hypothetical protein